MAPGRRTKPVTKVIFGGAYGIRSQGDDAALLALVQSLRQRTDSFEGVIIARHGRDDHYNSYGLRTLANFEYDRKADSLGKWFYGFNYSDDRHHLDRLCKEIGSSDILVYGAGNAMNDTNIDLLRGPVPYMAILILMAKMTGTPVMLFGISIGPLTSAYGQNLSRLIVNLAEVVTVRDRQSCTALRRLNYQGNFFRLPDPVLGLRLPPAEAAQAIPAWRQAHARSRRVFAVSVRNVTSPHTHKPHHYLAAMAATCDLLVSRHQATLLFIPQCTYQYGYPQEDDRQVARLIVDRMRQREHAVLVEEDLTVEQCLSLYHQADLVLGTRLHANVFAAMHGVPAVAVSYHHKVREFMQWLGCGHLSVSLRNLDPSTILAKADQALADRDRLSQAILARVATARQEIEGYADLAWDLITIKSHSPGDLAALHALKDVVGAPI